jgi:2-methylcitrate dehydratase PrpD
MPVIGQFIPELPMLQSSQNGITYTEFILDTRFEDIPLDVVERVKDLILDLIGVSAAAHGLVASRIARETAIRLFNTDNEQDRSRILFDGRMASMAGAAYAGATQIDSLDAHDGFSRAKGHAGCGLLPAVLAFCEGNSEFTGREFLTSMVIGYEIACRAGLALHDTACDYHTSGAWVSLAVGALGVRLGKGTPDILRQSVGIAEYHGPRSQMMREIDNPTMLHDGSGWGSMVGVVSSQLALSGFEGAPAVTIESPPASNHWNDLGEDWLTLKQNIKLFPICRWAHAPIQAAIDLRKIYSISPEDIRVIEISSFHEATRLAQDMPLTTGKAQYSISYPVAAALVYGQVTAREVSGETFADPAIAELVTITNVEECAECNAGFPQDRLGRTIVELKDGRRLDSGITRAPGEPVNPVDRCGIINKFDAFTHRVLASNRAENIKKAVFALDEQEFKVRNLTDLLYPAIQN